MAKIQTNNCRNDFDFYWQNYHKQENEQGSVFTWGSGEMGQLGYSNKVIQIMPKDKEGYPFQVSFTSFDPPALSFGNRESQVQRHRPGGGR